MNVVPFKPKPKEPADPVGVGVLITLIAVVLPLIIMLWKAALR